MGFLKYFILIPSWFIGKLTSSARCPTCGSSRLADASPQSEPRSFFVCTKGRGTTDPCRGSFTKPWTRGPVHLPIGKTIDRYNRERGKQAQGITTFAKGQ
jgi:hypothetical protein